MSRAQFRQLIFQVALFKFDPFLLSAEIHLQIANLFFILLESSLHFFDDLLSLVEQSLALHSNELLLVVFIFLLLHLFLQITNGLQMLFFFSLEQPYLFAGSFILFHEHA